MGTRGFLGFVANERESIAYAHSDAYPAGLGVTALTFLKGAAHEIPLKDRIAALTHVSEDVPPTHAQVRDLALKFANFNVSTQDAYEWYVLLRATQGDPGAILESGYIEHDADWPLDSLWCEWGYLIDTDSRTFEVYEGLQNSPHDSGRFANRTPSKPRQDDSYYPVKLLKSYPFTALPTEVEMTVLEEENS